MSCSPEEEKPLLPKEIFGTLGRRYCNTSKIVRSKEALLVLVLNFFIHIIYYSFISPTHYVYVHHSVLLAILVNSSFSTLLRFTYPFAGYLADTKFGRLKTLLFSLKVLSPGVALVIIGGAMLLVALVLLPTELGKQVFYVLLVIGSFLFLLGFLLTMLGVIGFKANVIQFGLDQLFDSPCDEQVVFVYWCTWAFFLARLLMHFVFATAKKVGHSDLVKFCSIGITLLVSEIFILVLWQVARRHQTWFLVSTESLNPYRLVYLVTRFSWKHKVPVYRSAFTYCEDEIPSGLDLGKGKYGGPFTTEQVEDVKVFYGILKVLFAVGPTFALLYICDPMISVLQANIGGPNMTSASNPSTSRSLQTIGEILFDALDQIFVLVVVPTYLVLIRPFISYYTPGILKKMGVAMTFALLGVVVLFVMELVLHEQREGNRNCMFAVSDVTAGSNDSHWTESTTTLSLFNSMRYFSVIYRSLVNVLVIFSHVSVYEFVCSQGPHAMKGFLIGITYALRGFSDMLGPLFGFLLGWFWPRREGVPSCGMVFYLVTLVLGIFSLFLFVYVSSHYKYRVRDEPCRVQQYVENFYYKYSRMSRERKRPSNLIRF